MAGPIGFALDRSDRGLRRRRAARAVVFITLPVLVLSLFLSAWFVKGMMAGAIKG